MNAHSLKSLAALSLFATVGAGCPLVSGSGGGSGNTQLPVVPSAELRAVDLTERPSYAKLGAYYCGDFADGNPLLEIGCEGFFGAAPAKSSLKFGFTTTFELSNDNDFPVPLLEMLLALDVFEGTGQAALGTVCVSFCEDPESGDCEMPTAPCEAPDNQIDGLEDFVPDIDDLIGAAIGAINGDNPLDDFDHNLGLRYIPAQGSTETAVRFELDIDAMLGLVGELVGQSQSELLRGDTPTFDIPFSAQGSLFFELPLLGRNALGYGPLDGSWALD